MPKLYDENPDEGYVWQTTPDGLGYWQKQENALPTTQDNWAATKGIVQSVLGGPIPDEIKFWPRRLLESGGQAANDALSGRLPFSVGLRREDLTTDTPAPKEGNWFGNLTGMGTAPSQPVDEMIGRAQDMSALAAGGTAFAPKPSAVISRAAQMDKMASMGRQNMQTYAPVLAADSEAGTGVAAVKNAAPFYSSVERAVASAKMNTGTADQWLGYLRNQPGVKAEELGYLNLDSLPKGQISKAELDGFIKENGIKLEEKYRGKYEPDKIDAKQYHKDLEHITKQVYGRETTYDELASSQQSKVREMALKLAGQTPTKYSQWQLPGGENYRETLITLPSKPIPHEQFAKKYYEDFVRKGGEPSWEELPVARQEQLKGITPKGLNTGDQFTSSHWSEPNVLVHVRSNDRNIVNPDFTTGKSDNPVLKSLHIEEIQSDWHQKGRKEGYRLSKEAKDKLEPEFERIEQKILDSNDEAVMGHPEIREAVKMAVEKKIITKDEATNYLKYADSERVGAVPDAPFKSTWSDLAVKRMIREAAEKGYDAISWTPGEAQAARYDLSKQVDKIMYQPSTGDLWAHKGQKRLINEQNVTPDKLADYVGKEAAEKLLNNPTDKFPPGHGNKEQMIYELSGDNLKIGGEGMKAFYDKMLVDKFNNIAKKFGGKVEQNSIIPDKVTDFVDKTGTYWVGYNNINAGKGSTFTTPKFKTKQEAENYVKENNIGQPIHILKLTPELRQHALEHGFPLFEGSVPIIKPVDYDPWNRRENALKTIDKNKKYRISPIDYNPWGK